MIDFNEEIKKECRNCVHFFRGNEGGGIEAVYFWNDCDKTSYSNLNSFPFTDTKCRYFEPRERRCEPTWQEKIRNDLAPR